MKSKELAFSDLCFYKVDIISIKILESSYENITPGIKQLIKEAILIIVTKICPEMKNWL
jgi:hypothetical protein